MFTDNEDRPGEKRIHCMVFDEKHERLMTGKCWDLPSHSAFVNLYKGFSGVLSFSYLLLYLLSVKTKKLGYY